MALFGAPLALEDHAQQACYAALSIQHALIPYSRKLKLDYGIDFKMRIGLNSGSVVVGAIGDELRMDYTAQGDTANLAARMESTARPGTVLVAEPTCKLVGSAFEFESLGKIQVKGKEKPVAVFRLKDKEFKARARSERKVHSEMVGRDHELARLELQIQKGIDGEGSVVNVVGEAGIGKSRLLAELRKSDVVKQVILLEGRAISMGRKLSYYPVIDLIKNWARIREDDGEAAATAKLQNAIRQVSVGEGDEIFPFVATLMGMKLSGKHAERIKGIEGESLEKLIFKYVRELLILSTGIIPIVIVIEDLHWADTSSLLLIDELNRLTLTRKIVFIHVFRPGYWDDEEKTPANLKDRVADLLPVEIVLQPLDFQHSEALINNMLHIKGLHHGVKTQIIERAGGNPFFIEEVVRTLIDEGAFVVKDTGFEITDRIQSVIIPQTINDVLMARIDRLDEESRNVIKVASVIGRSFFYRILADIVSDVDDLNDRLENLKQSQLIRERVRMEEVEYFFKHALAQEAAYESTLLLQRKQLHLKVAESIERIFSERLHEFYGLLAYHYSQGDDLEKAGEWMTKAGEEALRSSASVEALHYFQEALRLYLAKSGKSVETEKLADFEKKIAIAYFNRGQHDNALLYFDKVFQRWGKHSPKRMLTVMINMVYICVVIWFRQRFPGWWKKKMPDQRVNVFFDLSQKKARSLMYINPKRMFMESIVECRESLNYDLKKLDNAAGLHLSTGGVLCVIGFFRIGELILVNAGKLVDAQKVKDVVVYNNVLSVCNFLKGKWTLIPKYDPSISALALKNGFFWDIQTYFYFQGLLKTHQGNFDEAEERCQDIMALWTELGYRRHGVLSIELMVVSRRLVQAKNEAMQAIAVAEEMGSYPFALMGFGWKTTSEVLMKDLAAAEDSLTCADSILKMRDFWPPWNLASILVARFMYDIGRLEDAIRSNDRSAILKTEKAAFTSGKHAVKNAAKYASHRTWNYRLMGECFWLVGKQRKAFGWFDRSIREGERLGARPDLSRTYMAIGKCMLAPQSRYRQLNGISAPEYLNKAGTLFREMNLQWDLEQLERVRVDADG
jgi:tetratricopeptide (TPR) repeat protein